MLNVPEPVKQLFLRDGVYKNFRATFEDGSPDITNKDIVQESLNLRESISSSDSLTFGAAEAPTIEFETVGVPNILGKWFTAWLEVDASTLPTYLQFRRADLSVLVYPVPLGRFVVTACPRDQQASAHRKVSASASGVTGGVHLSQAVESILSKEWNGVKHSPTFLPVDHASILVLNDYMEAKPQNVSAISSSMRYTSNDYLASYEGLGRLVAAPSESARTIGIRVQGFSMRVSDNSVSGIYGLYRYASDWAYRSVDDIKAIMRDTALQLMAAYPDGLYLRDDRLHFTPIGLDALSDWLFHAMYAHASGLSPCITYTNSTGNIRVGTVYICCNEGQWFPGLAGAGKSIYEIGFHLPFAFSVDDGATYYQLTNAQPVSARMERYWVDPENRSPADDIRYLIEPSSETQPDKFTSIFNRQEIETAIKSALELNGAFGQYARDGRARMAKFSKDTPIHIYPGQYESCWWDDYDVAPIGSILYRLNGNDMVYAFGYGKSTYSLACTDIFEKLHNPAEYQIQRILDAKLVPALEAVAYTPASLAARGRPDLEAGDFVIIHADDDTEVPTFVLERELSGIQHLTDNIAAEGMTIVEVETNGLR